MRTGCRGSVVACLLASALTLSCAKDPEVAKRAYLESGDTYFAATKYKEAIVEYRNAIQQDQRFGEARYRLAEAYVRDNDPVKAYREYIRAADLMPANVEAQLKAGHILLLARQFENAKARADQVLVMDPGNVQALVLRGTALAGLKDLDSAITQIEEAITLDPERSATYANLGALQLAKGDLERAEGAFTKAVQIDGTSASARLALAVFYLSTRRAAEAEDALRRTLEIDPTNLAANRAIALMYLASHRPGEAEPYLKTVADVSETASGRLALADYYTLMNRSSDAVRILTTVGNKDPQALAAAQTRLAAIEYSGAQVKEAHKRLDDTLARQPDHSAALLLKARFLLAERQLDGALTHAKAATQAAPASAQAQFFLGKVFVAAGQLDDAAKAFNEVLKLNPGAAAAQVELSRAQLAVGNVEASIASARQALKGQPDNLDARLLLVRGLIARRELGQAEHEAKALAAKHPGVSAVHSLSGLLNFVKGNRTAAKRFFDRALALDGRSREALSGLVGLDLEAGKTLDARARLEVALTATPNDVGLLLFAAGTYAISGDPARAEQAVHRAIEIDPASLQAQALLGQLLIAQQKLEQARVTFETVAKRRPESNEATAAQTTVALILEAQNRPAEAQRLYEQILAASPRNIVAANNLAWLYAERGGNLDVALDLAQTAVQQAPDDAAFNDTLGWIYYKKDLLGQAIAALRRSVEKDSTNPEYHYHLGLAYARNGDRTNARRSLETALALEPDFRGSSDARKVLASLPT